MTELRPATGDDLCACLAFFETREHRCVGLSSRICREGRLALPGKREGGLWILRDPVAAAEPKEDSIAALFLTTPSAMLYHCVREGYDLRRAGKLLSRKLLCYGTLCIIGSTFASEALESIIVPKPRFRVEYDLMTLNGYMPGTSLSAPDVHPSRRSYPAGNPALGSATHPGQINVMRAGPAQLEALLPLQAGYEQEEVLLPGESFMKDRCRSLLKVTLSTQRVFAAWTADSPVAKAGTNACGIAWDQIGGVYTVPEFRQKGFGRAVFTELCNDRLQDGRKLSLFVKVSNNSAKKLYESEGFSIQEGFRIVYW